MNRRRWIVIAGLAVVTACTGTRPQPTSLYLLEQPDTPPPAEAGAGASLAIGRINLAGFLDQSGIVYQSANRISVARNHRWAAPLVEQLRPRFAAALAGHLDSATVHARPPSAVEDSRRLEITVDAFHGRDTGQALVAGSWRLVAPDDTELFSAEFRERVPLDADGYDALVAALDEGIDQAAESIARGLLQCTPCGDILDSG